MENKKSVYSARNLNFSYLLGKERTEALIGVDLEIGRGSFVTISGPSGSGKSTLLNILGLIEPVQGGELFFEGEEVSSMRGKKKDLLRKFSIGFIFQQFHLFPVLSAEENIRYFLSMQGLKKDEIEKRVEWSLQIVGLSEHRKKKPKELSGGQKQRVAIARAIAKKPSVIIADEPTASLDQKTASQILSLLKELVEKEGISIIMTSHDPLVLQYADENIVLRDGKIVREESICG